MSPRRIVLSVAAIVSVCLAFLGTMLPVLPTTPFLLVAAWCFARSNPKLGERLLSHRLFRPYRPFLDGSKPIPKRVRWITITVVWMTVAVSAGVLHAHEKLTPWLAVILFSAALIGSIAILRFRRMSGA